eukprot:21149-Heterococcus_DN1.PRE.1
MAISSFPLHTARKPEERLTRYAHDHSRVHLPNIARNSSTTTLEYGAQLLHSVTYTLSNFLQTLAHAQQCLSLAHIMLGYHVSDWLHSLLQQQVLHACRQSQLKTLISWQDVRQKSCMVFCSYNYRGDTPTAIT